MTDEVRLSDLFRTRPLKWGYRGDPHLWWDMRQRFASVPCPATGEELAAIVSRTFEELTGQPITHPEHFYVEKYSHGGMSSGYVAPYWWRDTAIPFLRERLEEVHALGGANLGVSSNRPPER